jgi:interferon, gamma-inducible protein 30
MDLVVSDFIGPNSSCPAETLSVNASEKEADDKIKIDLYFESQCPGCRQLITTSFAEAMKADSFLQMAELNFWPYGNAHEYQSGNDWTFTCQHGEPECQYNFIETCAKNLVGCPFQYFNFLNCVESSDTGRDYETVAKNCASSAGVTNIDDIMSCYRGSDASAMEHQVALKTEALNPPHKWVPWVTVNDVYDEKVQDDISDSLLKFVCQNYKGKNKSKDCPAVSSSPEVKSSPQNLCLRESLPLFLH